MASAYSLSQEHNPIFGKELRKQFPFAPEWVNLNHGSFGSLPNVVRQKSDDLRSQTEARPDWFIRYEYPKLLDENRAAVAELVNAPLETVVFVSNATVGVNTVFRNIRWNPDGKDVALCFSTVYGACGKVIDYMTDYHQGLVSSYEIPLAYPAEDADVVQKFRDAVRDLEAEGRRARIVVIDVVSSLPGGIGMLPLDLSAADPDFFVSNCHKWLHVPRGSAVFYVPVRNQHLIATTLATSHGYIPRTSNRLNPLPPSSKSPLSPISSARLPLGSEQGRRPSHRRPPRHPVMENATGSLTNCAMANIALPIWVGEPGAGALDTDVTLTSDESAKALQWILRTLMSDHNTFVALFIHGGRYFTRVSAQVYLDLDDYRYGAKALKDVCDRLAKREFL
ncbi:unnamed protein product [Parascedosporium putredinis]|uniref:Aminotransferase class V domain-containing protein n=1 Tax=Parascedosporium putredinis TaxID=1442378 RepID=A0A9P1HCF5_9PEZI|nr:unnamed protein product [Parascedosporium putredinis]CAI8003022.1 unnamed protein product [Parascedosporium putredinis]